MTVELHATEILAILHKHGVKHIVVGGIAAVLNGAGISTFDLDILHARTPENIARLLVALRELDAHYRHDSRRLVPDESHLIGPGHQLLRTRLGDMDVLGTIEAASTYEQLLQDSREMDVDGMGVQVLGMRRLIAAKEYANRPKDIAALPVLRAALAESEKGKT